MSKLKVWFFAVPDFPAWGKPISIHLTDRENLAVILSEAKNLSLRREILRFAQNDN
jgi:hypothetical protein